MGLLDEAIREHLELKRLRGADPASVSREEHEALGAIHDGELDEDGHGSAPAAGDENAEARGVGFAHGQETAEIDMQAVLHEEPEMDSPSSSAAWPADRDTAAAPVRAPPAPDKSIETASEHSARLDWEIPEDEPHEHRVEPGQPDRTTQGVEEPVEDVLEETPDFLRDTPEQERLWFEQRPPRDFDFDR